ncbi:MULTISPECIES: PorP/SprF family type IX secretion system membrane protein [unclassified Carboxylicivirga]|uniref:PorP/SprF family type IX secretion system membrane protein n=1 Tax=Carboxylicivirga TaxID=1628153 RepID=UPI003D3367BC
MRKSIFLVIVYGGLLLTAKAQLNADNSQYLLNPVSINPAMAGAEEALNVFAFYNKQWAGMDGAPSGINISADAPFFKRKVGLGLMLTHDKIGVTTDNQVFLSYAYRVYTAKGILSLGIGGGVKFSNTDYSQLVALHPDDNYYLQNEKIFALPVVSFGVNYAHPSFFVGLSIPSLVNHRYLPEKEAYEVYDQLKYANYLLHAGTELRFSNDFSIEPSVLLRYANIPDETKWQFDANALFAYRSFLWLGASYRYERSLSALLRLKVTNQLDFGYIYHHELSRLARYAAASHEVMIKYTLRFKADAISPLDY